MKIKHSLLILLISFTIISANDKLKIPKFVLDYLKEENLTYTIPKGNLIHFIDSMFEVDGEDRKPWKVIADFNGDGIDDYAGILANEKDTLQLIIIYSVKGKFKHVIMCEDCGKDDNYINVGIYPENPGIIHSFPFEDMKEEDEKDTLKFTGVTIEHFEASSATHFWKSGKFMTIWTSD